MKRIVRKWLYSQRARAHNQRIRQIKEDFYVTEKDGKIWLMHCGIAIMQIENHVSAGNVASVLNHARNVAEEYEKLSFQ